MNQSTIPALPEYVCHKRVQAAKIKAIADAEWDGTYDKPKTRIRMLELELPDGSERMQVVTIDFINKNKPEVGGYFVRYADGYSSYSPAQAFEEGYSRVPDLKPVTLAMLERERQEVASIMDGTHPTLGGTAIQMPGEDRGADLEFPSGAECKEPGRE